MIRSNKLFSILAVLIIAPLLSRSKSSFDNLTVISNKVDNKKIALIDQEKEDEKENKKKAKEKRKADRIKLKVYKKMSAQQIMELDNEYAKKVEELKKCQESTAVLENSVLEMEQKNSDLEASINKKNEDMVAMQQAIENFEKMVNAEGGDLQGDFLVKKPGVYFMIQIGALKKKKVSKRLLKYNPVIEMHEGYKKFLINETYTTLSDAKNELKKVQRQGFRDAWIIRYKDGVRVQ